jgi:hypothetical protein
MPSTDEHQQIIRALRRRLALALGAPPERFGGEVAAYLGHITASPPLRAVVAAALAGEAAALEARRALAGEAAREYLARSAAAARVLAQWLGPWASDGTLPEWFGPLLERCGGGLEPSELGRVRRRWEALRETLVVSGLHTGEVVRLLADLDASEARWLALGAAEQRRAAVDLSGALARLWGHVSHTLPPPGLTEWSAGLALQARSAWEQSSLLLLRRELAGGGGASDLHAGLRHDLRRLTATIIDGLEARPPGLPALERFRHWCETYERAALLRKSRPGKKATESTRKRKHEAITAELLRYLYNQGFTPLTLDMLEGGGEADGQVREALLRMPHLLLLKVLLVGEREALLRGYVACVHALRAGDYARRLGLYEAFLVAFVVEPVGRFAEPAPLPVAGTLLRSLFIDLTKPTTAGRLPLGVEAIAARVAEEDRLFEFLNIASEDELDSVAGIGPAKLRSIIAGRPYGRASDLQRAGLPTSGALYEALRERALQGMQTLVSGVGN